MQDPALPAEQRARLPATEDGKESFQALPPVSAPARPARGAASTDREKLELRRRALLRHHRRLHAPTIDADGVAMTLSPSVRTARLSSSDEGDAAKGPESRGLPLTRS
jgi:hypothetical protein